MVLEEKQTSAGGGRKQAADAGRRDTVSGGGQGRLADGWAGGWPPGCPMAPGQGWAPRLFQLDLTGNLGREKCPWQDATTRGSLLLSQPTLPPVLGLTTPLAGWPKPGPRASAPYCPFFPRGQARGLPPTAPFIHSFDSSRSSWDVPGTGVGAAERSVLPHRAFIHSPPISSR